MKQNLPSSSRRTLWALLSLALLWQTACSNKQTESPITLEEAIQQFKKERHTRVGHDRENYKNVLQALEAIQKDEARINDKVSLFLSKDDKKPTKGFPILFGALIVRAPWSLLQALKDLKVGVNETISYQEEDYSLLALAAEYAPRDSIEWLLEQKAKIYIKEEPDYYSVFDLWDNEKLSPKDKKELILSFIERKTINIEERDEDKDNLLGYMCHEVKDIKNEEGLMRLLLSEHFKDTGIRGLLFSPNEEGKLPINIALEYDNKKVLNKLLRDAMISERKVGAR